jgi:hypothetical protein
MNIHERIVVSLEAAKTCGSLSKCSEAVNQKNTARRRETLYRLLAVLRPAGVQYNQQYNFLWYS